VIVGTTSAPGRYGDADVDPVVKLEAGRRRRSRWAGVERSVKAHALTDEVVDRGYDLLLELPELERSRSERPSDSVCTWKWGIVALDALIRRAITCLQPGRSSWWSAPGRGAGLGLRARTTRPWR